MSSPTEPTDVGTAPYTTASELFEALSASELKVRAQATTQVGKDPLAAYELGTHAGRDLVDVLITLVHDEPRGSVFGQAFARILCLFSDPRVTALFTAGVAEWTEFVRLEAALSYLGAVSPDTVRELLFHETRADLRHGSARALLAGKATLSTRERLRAALLEGLVPPNITAESLPEWLVELSGPMRHVASRWVSRQDADGVRALLTHWATLSPALRTVVLKTACRVAVEATLAVLRDAFESSHTNVQLAAFECLAALGAAGDAVRPPMSRFVESQDLRVVRAAVRYSALDVDLHAAFGAASPVELQASILQRRAREDAASARTLWLAALVHSRWQMRGLAAKQLAAMGPVVHDDVRPLLDSPREEVRLAAAQVLRGAPVDVHGSSA